MWKSVLITGATSGIGYALTFMLENQCEHLILVGRNQDVLQELKLKLHCPTTICRADLTHDRREVVDLIREFCPELVINNAGSGLYGDVLLHTTREQLEMLELNINAVVELTLESAKTLSLHRKKGIIVNVSSAAGFFEYPSFNLYAASKGFVNQFSKTLDRELSSKQIRVLTSCPGMVATQFRTRASKGLSKNDFFAMSPKKAARLILHQIEHRIPLYIFDYRTRLLVLLTRFLPKRWVQNKLKKAIDKIVQSKA